MSQLQFTLVGQNDEQNIVVFLNDEIYPAHSSHPNYDAIVQGALEGDESIVELFDVAQSAAHKFEGLSERISVANGRLYLDGDEVHNVLAQRVLNFLEQGVDDWKPLVLFFENVQANENPHSKEMLYRWLEDNSITIDEAGLIAGYKGVQPTDDGGFQSISSGKALVNGVEQSGQIRQNIGDVVSMPRSEVQHDPAIGCHTGLHVGNYSYAQSFARGALLDVRVNPRDVVSVPTDCDSQKLRCCRYRIVDVIDAPHTAAVLSNDYEDDYRGWGDGEYDDEPDDYPYGDEPDYGYAVGRRY